MNKLNYASPEASKRLVKARIVLVTDVQWYGLLKPDGTYGWFLVPITYNRDDSYNIRIPAHSMAEVWRELPERIKISEMIVQQVDVINDHRYPLTYSYLTMQRVGGFSEAGYTSSAIYSQGGGGCIKSFENTNPADALIDLLIWVRKGAK
jgi:hypothetical protein